MNAVHQHLGDMAVPRAVDDLERASQAVDVARIPALLGDLERIRVQLATRLNAATCAPVAPTKAEPDRLLTAKEAAEIFGVKTRWLYDHQEEIPGTQRLSRRCLRFSEKKLRRWLEARGSP